MAIEIIYSHIPKCGGVSFRKALMEHYKPNEILHPWFWFQTRPEYDKAIKMWSDYPNLKRQWGEATKKIHPNIKVIMGHFPMRLFDDLYPDAFRMIWLRYPIDRVVSAYYHFSRNEFLVGDHTKPYQRRWKGMSPEAFAMLPRQQNVQHHFFQSAQAFDFIGIVEKYRESLDKLAGLLGWEPTLPLAHFNRGTYEPIEQKLRSLIDHLNLRDAELYRSYAYD